MGSDSGGFESVEQSSSAGPQSPAPAMVAIPTGDTGSLASGGSTQSPGIVVEFTEPPAQSGATLASGTALVNPFTIIQPNSEAATAASAFAASVEAIPLPGPDPAPESQVVSAGQPANQFQLVSIELPGDMLDALEDIA